MVPKVKLCILREAILLGCSPFHISPSLLPRHETITISSHPLHSRWWQAPACELVCKLGNGWSGTTNQMCNLTGAVQWQWCSVNVGYSSGSGKWHVTAGKRAGRRVCSAVQCSAAGSEAVQSGMVAERGACGSEARLWDMRSACAWWQKAVQCACVCRRVACAVRARGAGRCACSRCARVVVAGRGRCSVCSACSARRV